jgi:spermidine synthase
MKTMRKYIYAIVFTSGLTSLAVELSASRLLGNYFGTSNLVWASIIGLILIYLTIGYAVGGRLADRFPQFNTLFAILAWASFSIGLIPIASRPVLRIAANAFDTLSLGVLAGSFTSVIVLFIIPVSLLGMVSPFAIRLTIQDPQQAGRISGRIYAISTLGSFIGTFLPVLVLIPLIGTYRTFLTISLTLMLVTFAGMVLCSGWKSLFKYIWMPLIIVLLFLFGTRGTDKNTNGLIYEGESAYNYIQVLQNDGYTLLRLNEGQGVHSIYHPTILNFNGPWEQVMAAPFFNTAPVSIKQVTRMAIVGLAAGTTAREASAVFPDIAIDGIEIDPRIIDIARLYFDMNESNLNVIVQDGRWALEKSPDRYDIISVDAYRPPYIPWHMTTQEFFQIVFNHLDNDGVMIINVGRGPTDRRLLDSLCTTIGTVFPSVYVSDLSDSFNSLVFATRQETSLENFVANYIQLYNDPDTPALLLDVMSSTYAGIQAVNENGMVFTDDLAPVEYLTNSMVLNYIFSGEIKDLQ